MGIFFRKSVKIAPGVRLNFGKRGTSVSIGPRGAKVNFSKRGTYLNTSIPGSGIYMREKISGGKHRQIDSANKQSDIEAINKNPLRFSVIFICLLLAVAVPMVGGGSWWFFPGFFIGGIILGSLIPSKKEDRENGTSPSTLTNKPLDILKEEVTIKLDEPINYSSNIDPLFMLAARLVVAEQKGSTSLIQRKFEIGYNRAGYLMDQLEAVGIVGSSEGNRERLVLIKTEYELEMLLNSINYNEDIVLRESYIETETHDKLNMPSQPIDQSSEKEVNTEPIILPVSDSLFNEAARLIVINQQGSTSLIQRKFAIGYNRAGRLMDLLEMAGIVGAFEGSRAREVFIKNEEDLEQILNRIQIKECTETDYKEYESKNSAINQDIIDAENSSRLIPIAQSLEKEGMIDEAIAVYEKSILSKIPATAPYDRLMILYRKKKDYDNEIRIIKEAISVFMSENERRAGRVIEGDSSLYNEVMQALETNESIRYNDGKWAFVQYNVMDYITRLEKAKKLNEKSKKQTKSEINE